MGLGAIVPCRRNGRGNLRWETIARDPEDGSVLQSSKVGLPQTVRETYSF